MGLGKLVSMELDDEEKIDFYTTIECPRPDYPYGLRLTLSEKELKKLGMSVPGVGEYIDLRAFACVKSVSCDESSSGETCRVELQIEKIATENEDQEIPDEREKPRRSLYRRRSA